MTLFVLFFAFFHLILSYQINSYLLDYTFVSRNQNPLNVANTCSCDDNITAFKSFFKSISNFIKCSYDPVLKKLSIFQIAFFEELKKYFTCSLWFQTTQWRFMVYIANRTIQYILLMSHFHFYNSGRYDKLEFLLTIQVPYQLPQI